MKLLVPIFKRLPVHSGTGIRNISALRKLAQEIPVQIQLWKDFEILESHELSFQQDFSKICYFNELFSPAVLEGAQLATVEFAVPDSEKAALFKDLFETQCLLKSKTSGTTASVLFDLIADKKPGHKYTPILHAAHSGYSSDQIETWAVFVNHRPAFLKSSEPTQKMLMQAFSPDGKMLLERALDIAFNSTTEISFDEMFESVGGFHPGCSLNFRGGQSQFAIFTVFFNRKSQALGIEHSLPPIYYCSDIYKPDSRKVFYANAFSGTKGIL